MSKSSPINIDVNNNYKSCDMRCKYVFNYGQSTAILTNGTLNPSTNNPIIPGISLGNYTQKNHTTVSYNNTDISESINPIIFVPSLHTFDNKQADGELVIVHTGSGKTVIVSIPIVAGDSDNTLQAMLSNNLQSIPSLGKTKTVSTLYSLNDYIPLNEPYYVYSGNMFFSTKRDCEFIVYSLKSAFNLNSSTLNTIKSIIKSKQYPICVNNPSNPTCPTVLYNKTGASNSEGDEVYMDCNPTGHSGSVPVPVHPEHTLPDFNKLLGFSMNLSTEEIIIGIISGIAAIAMINLTRTKYLIPR